ncbi:Crp/Fnr family transcriptional regulator [Roseateles violae]|uniref:Crp/Fnr family transcriptional regulator n=1 Tax=Roseateles violae TaxID=3058042 RepID=A0ABT8DZA0_9BURK|nr:Crp/Fnr family transcriptional regulator [Pelomonas sp. PFR6]MDN3922923.1 Crp/Fnr family transcriptional regulator [Pelomonas sp. PFR6]
MSANSCGDCAIGPRCVLGRLEEAERALVAPHLRERIFHRGDALLEEGKDTAFVRVIKLGTAFVHRRGLDGRSRPIGVMGRGQAFGFLGMFGSPNQVSCFAHTTVRVCELPVLAMREMSASVPQFMVHMTRAVVENFASVAAWAEALRLPGMANQLAYVLVLLGDADKSAVVALPSHAALAELLGTRRESIARALRTLESEGGIKRLDRRRCELVRSALLARLSPHEVP